MVYRPIYYRWLMKDSDEVELSHNREGHPAATPTLGEMAAKHSGSKSGYAYRIHGGWRITTHEHRPVEDPHVQRCVAEAIAKAENFSK